MRGTGASSALHPPVPLKGSHWRFRAAQHHPSGVTRGWHVPHSRGRSITHEQLKQILFKIRDFAWLIFGPQLPAPEPGTLPAAPYSQRCLRGA